jgi:hypothetical protein
MAKDAAAKEYKYFTQPDGRVFLHPSSLNFTENEWLSPWLVYHDKQVSFLSLSLSLSLSGARSLYLTQSRSFTTRSLTVPLLTPCTQGDEQSLHP